MSLERGEGQDNLRFTKHFLSTSLMRQNYDAWNEARKIYRETSKARLADPKIFEGMHQMGLSMTERIFVPHQASGVVQDLMLVGAEMRDPRRIWSIETDIKGQLRALDEGRDYRLGAVFSDRSILSSRDLMLVIMGICVGGTGLKFREMKVGELPPQIEMPGLDWTGVDLGVFSSFINKLEEPPA